MQNYALLYMPILYILNCRAPFETISSELTNFESQCLNLYATANNVNLTIL